MQQLFDQQRITLTPTQRNFNLRVALTDYDYPEAQLFAYRIVGYQDEWQEDKSNLIRVSGLPMGNYTLEVKGKLADGRYSSHMIRLPIVVLGPIYLRWWFLLLVTIALLTSAYYLYQWRIRRLKKQQQVLEQAVQDRTLQIEKDKQVIETQAKELRNLDDLKSRFFANVSHELRTPLTLMLAPIENSLKHNDLTNRDHTNLLTAQRNGKRLHKMINEILDLTKLEAGKMTLNPQKVMWYTFLRTIIANFESLANRKEIDFEFEYQGSQHLQVKLDPNKTEIILVNLLSNAFKFTNPKGKVAVHTHSDGESLIVKVADTGRGIHPNDVPHIFNRFYQTKQKNAAAEGGTGIGLALSQEFVELMKGSLMVESELGIGTAFTLQLPRVEVVGQVETEEAERISNIEVRSPKSAPNIQ